MIKTLRASIFWVGLIILFTTCKKDDPDDGWEACLDCDITSWIGTFKGTAEFKDYVSGSTTSGLSITITITEISDNYLSVQINIPNYYSATLSGNYVGTYSISLASSNYSFSGNMQKKDNSLRLIGESKYFIIKVNEIITKKIAVFEAEKQI